jgi:cell division protein FtsI/penicillin-binding protein 2
MKKIVRSKKDYRYLYRDTETSDPGAAPKRGIFWKRITALFLLPLHLLKSFGKFKKRQIATEEKNTSRGRKEKTAPIKGNFVLGSAILSALQRVTRETVLKAAFVACFLAIIVTFAQLQVFSSNPLLTSLTAKTSVNLEIILSRRGGIFVTDISQNYKDIEVTSSQSRGRIFINPRALKKQLDQALISKDEAILYIAGTLNMSYKEVEDIFTRELTKDNLAQYIIINKDANLEQQKAVQNLRTSDSVVKRSFAAWLGLEIINLRSYPSGDFLSATIGYMQRNPVTRDEALAISGCEQMVYENEQRGTVKTYLPGDNSKGEYPVGFYGIEQKFCSTLAGLNGRQILGNEVGTSSQNEAKTIDGANVYLTIDRNIQRKAEEVLDNAFKINTNKQGVPPKDGTILVIDTKTGAVLAMASRPSANPNEYYNNTTAFKNVATNVDYEVGSVMKPLTVAAALNEYKIGSVDSNGNRIGIPFDWTFQDYDSKGKPYPQRNSDPVYIRNSQGYSYRAYGNINLSQVLRDSINTGIAELQPSLGNRPMREYFEERYLMGQNTLINLPGDTNGNVNNLDNNLDSAFTYASFGFGQGFTISPLQLARAYTPLANNGVLLEPYLVDHIVYSDGTVDDGTRPDSLDLIKRPKPTPVLDPEVAQRVTQYLVDTLDQGYQGNPAAQGPKQGKVPGYTIAGKTGTAQVARGCDYDCNTLKGIYDHTYIGYGPQKNSRVMVLIKLSEPKAGDVNNFALNTLGGSFSEMMSYTLQYLGEPHDR